MPESVVKPLEHQNALEKKIMVGIKKRPCFIDAGKLWGFLGTSANQIDADLFGQLQKHPCSLQKAG
jgi:hypothetical protein